MKGSLHNAQGKIQSKMTKRKTWNSKGHSLENSKYGSDDCLMTNTDSYGANYFKLKHFDNYLN